VGEKISSSRGRPSSALNTDRNVLILVSDMTPLPCAAAGLPAGEVAVHAVSTALAATAAAMAAAARLVSCLAEVPVGRILTSFLVQWA
jgi:hypothetical protein